MDVNIGKVICLLEKVTSGNAGVIDLEYHPEGKSCTITWKRPRGLLGHESWSSRIEVLLYVKDLLMDAGVEVCISMESTLEWFTPEG